MTYQEAIKYAKTRLDGLTPYTPEESSEVRFYKSAIVAFEKHIPKKPKLLKNELLLAVGWQYGCPNCGCACGENKYHEEVTDTEYYCTQCGQALDWGDNDD